MGEKCHKCGGEKIPYVTDPDVVEDFCPDCGTIPSGATISGLYTFEKFITPDPELTQAEIDELCETTPEEIEELYQGAMKNIKKMGKPEED